MSTDEHALEKEEEVKEYKHLLSLKKDQVRAPKERKAKRRRKAEDLGPNERWNCPFGCGKFYRKTSTLSVKRHKQECPQRLMVTLLPQYRGGPNVLNLGVQSPLPTLAQLIPSPVSRFSPQEPSPPPPLTVSSPLPPSPADQEMKKSPLPSPSSPSPLPPSPVMTDAMYPTLMKPTTTPGASSSRHSLDVPQSQPQQPQPQPHPRPPQQSSLMGTSDFTLDELEFDIAAARARALSFSLFNSPFAPSTNLMNPQVPFMGSDPTTIPGEDSKAEIVSTLSSLAARDSWICPLRCGTWFRASSSLIAKHLAQCPHRHRMGGSHFIPNSNSFPVFSAPSSPSHFPVSQSFTFSRSQSMPPSPTAGLGGQREPFPFSPSSPHHTPLTRSASNNLLETNQQQMYLQSLHEKQQALHAAATAAYINASLSAPCSPVGSRGSSPSQLPPLLQRISLGTNPTAAAHDRPPVSRSTSGPPMTFTTSPSQPISSSSSSLPSSSSLTSSVSWSPTHSSYRRRHPSVSAPYLRKGSAQYFSRRSSPARSGSQTASPPVRYRRYSEPSSAPPSMDIKPKMPKLESFGSQDLPSDMIYPFSEIIKPEYPDHSISFQESVRESSSSSSSVSSPSSSSCSSDPLSSLSHLPMLGSLQESMSDIELVDDPMMKLSPKSSHQELFNLLGSSLSPPTTAPNPSFLSEPLPGLRGFNTESLQNRDQQMPLFEDWNGPEPIIKTETDDFDLSSLDGMSPFHDLGLLPNPSNPSSPSSPPTSPEIEKHETEKQIRYSSIQTTPSKPSSANSSGIFDGSRQSYLSTNSSSPVSSVTSTNESTPNSSGIYQEAASPRKPGLYNLFAPLERSNSGHPSLVTLNEDSLLMDSDMVHPSMAFPNAHRSTKNRLPLSSSFTHLSSPSSSSSSSSSSQR